MLGTLIEKLSALLSKSAFVASFIPLLAFMAANTGLLSAVNRPFRTWIVSHRTNAEFIGGVVIAFFIGALILATINTRLRELMEGRFWPRVLCGRFTTDQHNRLQALNVEYTRLQVARRLMSRQSQRWTQTLKDWRERKPKNPQRVYDPTGRAGSLIRKLHQQRLRGEVVSPEILKLSVIRLKRELRVNPMSVPLDADQVELNEIIRFADAKIKSEIIRIFNERQFSFPPEILAPTAMGNIALSIRSYTLSRYQLNIETFWTRFQKVMQGEPFYAVLQDSKVQLDFLVSLFWLSVISTAPWLISLAFLGYSLWLYVAIALTGPLAIWAFYRLALQNYRAFADLMRCSVDTYRIRLLKDLQLPEPTGSREEAALWQALQDRMDYGKDFNLGYRRSE
jgi:hypothetical protein